MVINQYDENDYLPVSRRGIIKHYVRRYPISSRDHWDEWEHFFSFQSMTYSELTSSYNVDKEQERRVLRAFVREMDENEAA